MAAVLFLKAQVFIKRIIEKKMFNWLNKLDIYNKRKNLCSRCQNHCNRDGYCRSCHEFSFEKMLTHTTGEIRELRQKQLKENSSLYKNGKPASYDRKQHKNQVHLIALQLGNKKGLSR
ncbi:MAG: hypothetical protein ACE5FU_12960, partial [Nitrospinota bacterium]